MDRTDNSKATPTKRTGIKNDAFSQYSRHDTGNDKDNNTNEGITPEILQPIPNSATPSIPKEIPAREMK